MLPFVNSYGEFLDLFPVKIIHLNENSNHITTSYRQTISKLAAFSAFGRFKVKIPLSPTSSVKTKSDAGRPDVEAISLVLFLRIERTGLDNNLAIISAR